MSSLPPIGPALAPPTSRPPRSTGAQDDGFDLALGAACSAHAARPESASTPKDAEPKHEVEPARDGRTRAIGAAPAAPFPGVARRSAVDEALMTPDPDVPAARPGPATRIEREPLSPVDAPAARGDAAAKAASSPESHGAAALEAIVVRGATRAIPPALAGEPASERPPKGSREAAGRDHAPESVSGDPAPAPSPGASDLRVESVRGVASARSRAPRARADARASSGAQPDDTTPRALPAGGLDAVAGDAAEPRAVAAAAPARALPDLPAANRPATQATLVFQDDAGLDGRITVALRGDRLRTTIVTSQPEAAERLSGRLGELQQALAARGLEDVQISVRSFATGTPHGGEDRGSRHEERPSPSSSRDPESHHPHGRTRQERRRDPSER